MTQNMHAGVFLKRELEKYSISQRSLADLIGVHPNRINEIVRGVRGISADTDLRLSRYFGTSEGHWLDLQMKHDLSVAKTSLGSDVLRLPTRVDC